MSAAESTNLCRRRVFVTGLVQDVWFRASTAKRAVQAGVRGWVRNLADGRVEAVLEGSAGAVNEMIDFCSQGPESARVDQIEVVEESPENLEDFRIR
jgi:acylphosphatase